MLGMILKLTPSLVPVFIRTIRISLPSIQLVLQRWTIIRLLMGVLTSERSHETQSGDSQPPAGDHLWRDPLCFERNIVSLFPPRLSIILFEHVAVGKPGKLCTILNAVWCSQAQSYLISTSPLEEGESLFPGFRILRVPGRTHTTAGTHN